MIILDVSILTQHTLKWTPWSNKLTSIVLSPKLPDDSKASAILGGLLDEELKSKEKTVFNNGVKEFHSFTVLVKTIACGMEDLQWKEFLIVPLRDTHKYAAIQK